MIYLFRKFNKQIVITTGAAAWEMYSSNGNWKYRPEYLGAVEDSVYRALKAKVKQDVPVDPTLYKEVNTGSGQRDGEMRAFSAARAKGEQNLLGLLVEQADKSVKPPNMDVVNAATLQPHERQAVKGLIG